MPAPSSNIADKDSNTSIMIGFVGLTNSWWDVPSDGRGAAGWYFVKA